MINLLIFLSSLLAGYLAGYNTGWLNCFYKFEEYDRLMREKYLQCKINNQSSRVCSQGTRGCTKVH